MSDTDIHNGDRASPSESFQLGRLIVAGVIRHERQILAVRQQGPDDPEPGWSIPGGAVKAGELLHQALTREVQEETGLMIIDPGRLLYTVHQDLQPKELQVAAFVFEVGSWQGCVRVMDPDDLILEARFLPKDELLDRMAQTAPRSMHEPLTAHLRERVEPGAVWFYRRSDHGQDILVHRIL